MAQNREKDETLELKVPPTPPETPQLSLSCPDSCKQIPGNRSSSSSSGPDPARIEKAHQPRLLGSKLKREDRVAAEVGPAEARRSDGVNGPDVAAEVGLQATVVPSKRAVNRCSGCAKRVGLTGFRCRCGELFCAEHRYSDRHECSYDYKAAGREAIARDNPVVRAAKILKV